MIAPDDFFSLKRFAHSALWKKGTPVWSALSALKEYLKGVSFQIEIEIPQGVFLSRPEQISIGEGTVIEPGAYIQGPCILGKGCHVRHGAYIRDHVICGDFCQIGHAAELKSAILLDGAAATHFVYVGDSILGNCVNLGAGVKCANLRLDRREVSLKIGGQRIATGLKKFGCIVGDRSQIGCNSVLSPGTLVGKESLCHPLVHLSGAIPAQSQIKAEGVTRLEPQLLEKLLWQSTPSAPM